MEIPPAVEEDKAFPPFLGLKKKKKKFLSLSESSDWQCGEVSAQTTLTDCKQISNPDICVLGQFFIADAETAA